MSTETTTSGTTSTNNDDDDHAAGPAPDEKTATTVAVVAVAVAVAVADDAATHENNEDDDQQHRRQKDEDIEDEEDNHDDDDDDGSENDDDENDEQEPEEDATIEIMEHVLNNMRHEEWDLVRTEISNWQFNQQQHDENNDDENESNNEQQQQQPPAHHSLPSPGRLLLYMMTSREDDALVQLDWIRYVLTEFPRSLKDRPILLHEIMDDHRVARRTPVCRLPEFVRLLIETWPNIVSVKDDSDHSLVIDKLASIIIMREEHLRYMKPKYGLAYQTAKRELEQLWIVARLLVEEPREVETQQQHGDNDGEEQKQQQQQQPILHTFLSLHTRTEVPMSIIQHVFRSHQDQLSQPDDRTGNLPLHLVVAKQQSLLQNNTREESYSFLLKDIIKKYPPALQVENRLGQLPIDVALSYKPTRWSSGLQLLLHEYPQGLTLTNKKNYIPTLLLPNLWDKMLNVHHEPGVVFTTLLDRLPSILDGSSSGDCDSDCDDDDDDEGRQKSTT